jgi:transcriptional regulator with XRE-family HTH domain
MLADTLRQARRKKGWGARHLSKRSGVSLEVIEQIESGSPSYVPSEGNTALLAEALRMPVGSLLVERDRLVERLAHRGSHGASV